MSVKPFVLIILILLNYIIRFLFMVFRQPKEVFLR
jgi:hypothetical protein